MDYDFIQRPSGFVSVAKPLDLSRFGRIRYVGARPLPIPISGSHTLPTETDPDPEYCLTWIENRTSLIGDCPIDIYKVTYSSPGLKMPAFTYMCVYRPANILDSVLELGYIPVIFTMDGGSDEHALLEDEEECNHFPELAILATGASYSSLGEAWDLGFPRRSFRNGPPMICVAWQQPGRGYGSDEDRYAATGNPVYAGTAPQNTYGQDYCGPMAVAAADAVRKAIGYILRDLWEDGCPLRIVVLSTSNGLTMASAWLGQTSLNLGDIHAFVDWEGPSDSTEQLLASYTVDPFEIQLKKSDDWELLSAATNYPREVWAPVKKSKYLQWRAWEKWFRGGPYREEGLDTWYEPPETLWMRPPRQLVEEMTTRDHDVGYNFCRNEITREKNWIMQCWRRRYKGVPAWSLAQEIEDFWSVREAIVFAPAVARLPIHIVRIQSNTDHAQPDWLFGLHAARMINAYLGEERRLCMVYCTDRGFWGAHEDCSVKAAGASDDSVMADSEPTPVTEAIPLDDLPYSPSADPPDPAYWADYRTGSPSQKIHHCRWAMAQDSPPTPPRPITDPWPGF